jgi:hypothetical protein
MKIFICQRRERHQQEDKMKVHMCVSEIQLENQTHAYAKPLACVFRKQRGRSFLSANSQGNQSLSDSHRKISLKGGKGRDL